MHRNLSQRWGITGELTGVRFEFELDVTTFGIGPKLLLPQHGRSPSCEAVGGWARTERAFGDYSETSMDWMLQPGAGIDIRLADGLAWRAEVDYRTIFGDPIANQVRLVTGIVLWGKLP
jgi:hypothetical protein